MLMLPTIPEGATQISGLVSVWCRIVSPMLSEFRHFTRARPKGDIAIGLSARISSRTPVVLSVPLKSLLCPLAASFEATHTSHAVHFARDTPSNCHFEVKLNSAKAITI